MLARGGVLARGEGSHARRSSKVQVDVVGCAMAMASDWIATLAADLRAMAEEPPTRGEAFAAWRSGEKGTSRHERAQESARKAASALQRSDVDEETKLQTCWEACFEAQRCHAGRMQALGLAGAQKMAAHVAMNASQFRQMRDELPKLATSGDGQVQLRTLQVLLTMLQVQQQVQERAEGVAMEVAMRLRANRKDPAVKSAADATVRQAVACALEGMDTDREGKPWETARKTSNNDPPAPHPKDSSSAGIDGETRQAQRDQLDIARASGEELVHGMVQDLITMAGEGTPVFLNAPALPRKQALELLDMALQNHANTLQQSKRTLQGLLRKRLAPLLHKVLAKAAGRNYVLDVHERDAFATAAVKCATSFVLQLHSVVEDEAYQLLEDITSLRDGPYTNDMPFEPRKADASALAALCRIVSDMAFVRSLYERKRGVLGEQNYLQRTIIIASQVTRRAMQADQDWEPCSLGDVAVQFARPDPVHEDEIALEDPVAHATHEASLAVLLFLGLASTVDRLAEAAQSHPNPNTERGLLPSWKPALARQLVSDLWGSLLPELSRWLSLCKEPDHSPHAVECMSVALLRALQQIAQAASAVQASAARDGALATLGAYALPRTDTESVGVDQLQAQALRTLFNTIHCLHQGLGAAWRIVLLPLLELDATIEQAGLTTDTDNYVVRKGSIGRTFSNMSNSGSMSSSGSQNTKAQRQGRSASADSAHLSVLAIACTQLFAATALWDIADAKDAMDALAALSRAGFTGATQRMVDIALAQLPGSPAMQQKEEETIQNSRSMADIQERADTLWHSCSQHLLKDIMRSDSAQMRRAGAEALSRMADFALSTDNKDGRINGTTRAQAAVQLWCNCTNKESGLSADVVSAAWEALRRSASQHSEPLSRAWDTLLPLLASAAKEGICVAAAFDVTQRLVEDELHVLPWKAHKALADTLYCFCTQCNDLNASLTAIRLLWNVIDAHARLLEKEGAGQEASEALSLQAFAALGACLVDERPEVRLGALRTLVAALGGRAGRSLSSDAKLSALAYAMLPRLGQVQALRNASCQSLVRRSVSSHSGQQRSYSAASNKLLLVHHSRDTAWKAWDETLSEAISGTARTALLLLPTLADARSPRTTPGSWFKFRSTNSEDDEMRSYLREKEKELQLTVETAEELAEAAGELLRQAEAPSWQEAWRRTCATLAHFAHDTSDIAATAAVRALESLCDNSLDPMARKSACDTLALLVLDGVVPSAKARKALGTALQNARHSLMCKEEEDIMDARLLQALRQVAPDSVVAWREALHATPQPCGEGASTVMLEEACKLLQDASVELSLIAETSLALPTWAKSLSQACTAADALAAACQRGSPDSFHALAKLCTERACVGVAQAIAKVFAIERSSSTYYSPTMVHEDGEEKSAEEPRPLLDSKLALVDALYAAAKRCRAREERNRSASFASALEVIAVCKQAELRESAMDALQQLCGPNGAAEDALPRWLNRCRLEANSHSVQRRKRALERLGELYVSRQAVRDALKALTENIGVSLGGMEEMLVLLEGDPPTEAQAQEHLLFAYEAVCKAAQVSLGQPKGTEQKGAGEEQEVHLLAIGLLMRIGTILGLLGRR